MDVVGGLPLVSATLAWMSFIVALSINHQWQVSIHWIWLSCFSVVMFRCLALAGSYRKWQAVATQCSRIQPAVIKIHQSRVSVWPAPLLSRPGVPYTPEQLEQKKIDWKWASSETSTESQFWLIRLTFLGGSWEQCEDDFKLKACAHAYVTDPQIPPKTWIAWDGYP